jgi:hypothetical protein
MLRTVPSEAMRTVDGNTRIPQARANPPSGSRSALTPRPVAATNWATAALDSLKLTVNTRNFPVCACASCAKEGISSRHGSHQLAQKLISKA